MTTSLDTSLFSCVSINYHTFKNCQHLHLLQVGVAMYCTAAQSGGCLWKVTSFSEVASAVFSDEPGHAPIVNLHGYQTWYIVCMHELGQVVLP